MPAVWLDEDGEPHWPAVAALRLDRPGTAPGATGGFGSVFPPQRGGRSEQAVSDSANVDHPPVSAVHVELATQSAGVGVDGAGRADAAVAPDRTQQLLPRPYPARVAGEIRRFSDVGVSHLALAFPAPDPETLTAGIDRFVAEVVPLV